MRRVLLLSDVHLSAARPAAADYFLNFLREVDAAQVSALYLLGDLFDAWLGDDDATRLGESVQAALKALTARGVAVFIQHGNRDFLLGVRFMNASGATLLPEAHVLEQGGGRYLLMHGDSLVADADYLRYRRRIRHPLTRALIALIPLPLRRRLAGRMRAASRGNVEQAVLDEALAASLLQKHGCRHLIHGHLHKMGEHQWQAGQASAEGQAGEAGYHRYCLPDWHDTGGGYAEISDENVRLCRVGD